MCGRLKESYNKSIETPSVNCYGSDVAASNGIHCDAWESVDFQASQCIPLQC